MSDIEGDTRDATILQFPAARAGAEGKGIDLMTIGETETHVVLVLSIARSMLADNMALIARLLNASLDAGGRV